MHPMVELFIIVWFIGLVYLFYDIPRSYRYTRSGLRRLLSDIAWPAIVFKLIRKIIKDKKF